jgi:choline-sulfatase
MRRICSILPLALVALSCSRAPDAAPAARNLVLITIDTLRADRVGAYGAARAKTPALDALARSGAMFERAYAAAPITLPSHATMMTGRYPPGHGARDNGIAVNADVPTLATELRSRGFKTGAFVAAFPLNHQFGLNRGFDVYRDSLPRGTDGRPASERPAAQVVEEAVAWLRPLRESAASRFFLWMHLFEPHAPYGTDPSRPVLDRYDEEITIADRAVGRLVEALGARDDTLIVVAGDHGEAFGEHGEYAHSIFVYDTTLRTPLVFSRPGLSRIVRDPVTLADVAPTAMRLLGFSLANVDGIDLSPSFTDGNLPTRELYAESFAPLVEFGWAPLRSIRSGQWKFIAAPTPELFDVDKDAGETVNAAGGRQSVARSLDQRVSRYSGATLPSATARADPQVVDRLRALGYSGGSQSQSAAQSPMNRPDPKDRRDLAARVAQVTSGELQGAALVGALEAIVRDDPRNGQAHLRLGFARLQAGDCARAEAEFQAAAASGLPSADVHLGLATCRGRRGDLGGAAAALDEARRLEPDNPVITANIGILKANTGDLRGAIESLTAAVAADPTLFEARFNLAVVYAKSGRRADAAAAASDLLDRLPPGAPQRPEVERLLKAVR